MNVSFVIPVRNDQRVCTTVNMIRSFVESEKISLEILIVGEMSNGFFINEATFIESNQPDKLNNVRTGIMISKGDFVVTLDADFPISNDSLRKGLKCAVRYDVVMGDRFLKESNQVGTRPVVRKLLTFAWRMMLALFFNIRGVDTQFGFKIYTSGAAKFLFRQNLIGSYVFELDVFRRVNRSKLSIAQLPISWCHKADSTLALPEAVILIAKEILELWLQRLTPSKSLVGKISSQENNLGTT